MKALVYTLLFFILFAAYCTAEADAAVDKDVVLAMAFDEGEGETAKDLSPHENHGRLKGNAGWGVGRFGNAVKFEPMGYVDAGNRRSLKLYKSDFTIAVWANMKETLFGNRHAFIAQDEGAGDMNRWILGYGFYGHPMFNLHTRIVFDDGHKESFTGFGGEAQPNSWHQIAVVRRRFPRMAEEKKIIYLDGRRISWSRSRSNVADDHFLSKFIDAPITIGWAEEDIAMDGLIDEVLIAKRAFTDDEITAHFQGGLKRGLGLAVQPHGKSAAVWGAIKAQILR